MNGSQTCCPGVDDAWHLPASVRRRRPVKPVSADTSDDLSRYARDPVGFARDVLKVEPTPDQQMIARAVLEPPWRVMVKSGHNVGKSFLMAWLIVWWYYTRPTSVALTTAGGKFDTVKDIVWTEVRLLIERAGLPNHFIGPAAPEMRDGPEHWAKGMTSSTGEGFQGRHRDHMFFGFDEAEDVDKVFWDAAGTMFHPNGTNVWLVILNPLTTTSQSYVEERAVGADGERKWRVFEVSSLNHPNILTALRNREHAKRGEPLEPIPIPAAVSIEQVETWFGDWFEELPEPDELDGVEWPPGSGRWWKPEPDGESRVLGRRPSTGTMGVWSERLWQVACRANLSALTPGLRDLPEIGCDVARFGDDRTEVHVRVGPCSFHHEDHGGWDTVRTADRLMRLADEWAAWATRLRPPQAKPVDLKLIRVKVDDTGVGGGVSDIVGSHGYSVVPVNAGSVAADATKYPRVRDELWFTVRERARNGLLDLSRLPKKRLAKLEVQALGPTWWPTPDRRRQVESKEDVKERLGRSPDGLDALNLAYWDGGQAMMEAVRADTGR